MMAWWDGRKPVAWSGAGVRGAMLALFVVGVTGCSGDEGPYARLVERAQEVRELALLEDVPYETLTPEQFRERVGQDVGEWTDAELREYADTYGRLGFFDVNLDLRPILTQSRIDATGAFYSAKDARITFIGEPGDDTVIHEYVHALQDQHFDLTAYDRGAGSSDEFLARRAVVEGDAVLAEVRFLIEEEYEGGLDTIDYDAYFASWSEFSERYLDDSTYPLIFRAYASFVYAHGLFFSAANLFGGSPLVRQPPPPPHNWTRQNELFTKRVPATTAEILSIAGSTRVGIDAVPAALATQLQRVGSDSLGAWYVYLLFRPVDLRTLHLWWDGDQVLYARHTTTGAVGVLWASAWDDERSAMIAEMGLRALHGTTGEPLAIERRGLRVVLARNFPADIVQVLVDAAFAGAPASAPARRAPLHLREAVRHADRHARR